MYFLQSPPLDEEYRHTVNPPTRRYNRPQPPTRWMNTREAAAYIRRSEWTLRKLVKEHKIKAIFEGKAGRSPLRFDIRELDRYMESNQFPKPRK